MKNIKYKKLIIFCVILILLIIPKLLITPIANNYKPFEPKKIEVKEDAKQWLNDKKNKLDDINKVAKENSIVCEYGENDLQKYIVSKEANVPVDDLVFKSFLNIIENGICEEYSRIEFNKKDDKKFDFNNYEFLKNLTNSITENSKYDYQNINIKINNIIKDNKSNKPNYVEDKIGEYNLKIEINISNDVTNFKYELRRKYELSKKIGGTQNPPIFLF